MESDLEKLRKLSAEIKADNEMSVWDAIDEDDGTDDLIGHLLDDWLEAEMQEEAEAEGWL
jgi:hypothetical protein